MLEKVILFDPYDSKQDRTFFSGHTEVNCFTRKLQNITRASTDIVGCAPSEKSKYKHKYKQHDC